MILHYLKIAFRNIWKNKFQSLLNILGLAVGFTFFSCWMFFINYSTENSYPRAERSYNLSAINSEGGNMHYSMSLSDTNDRYQQVPQIEEITYSGIQIHAQLRTEDKEDSPLFNEGVQEVDTNFFSFHSITLEPESHKKITQIPDALILPKRLAKKMFGYKKAIGKTVYISGMGTYTVYGILNEDITVAKGVFILNNQKKTTNTKVYPKIRIKKNSSPKEFLQYIERAQLQNPETGGKILKLEAYPEKVSQITPQELLAISIIILIGSLLLISALFNYISFTLSLFFKRTRECGIRKVAGSNRLQLFYLFFGEILIGLFVAFLFSLFIIELILPILDNRLSALDMYFSYHSVRPLMWLYFLWGILLAGLLCIPVVWRIDRMSMNQPFNRLLPIPGLFLLLSYSRNGFLQKHIGTPVHFPWMKILLHCFTSPL